MTDTIRASRLKTRTQSEPQATKQHSSSCCGKSSEWRGLPLPFELWYVPVPIATDCRTPSYARISIHPLSQSLLRIELPKPDAYQDPSGVGWYTGNVGLKNPDTSLFMGGAPGISLYTRCGPLNFGPLPALSRDHGENFGRNVS